MSELRKIFCTEIQSFFARVTLKGSANKSLVKKKEAKVLKFPKKSF